MCMVHHSMLFCRQLFFLYIVIFLGVLVIFSETCYFYYTQFLEHGRQGPRLGPGLMFYRIAGLRAEIESKTFPTILKGRLDVAFDVPHDMCPQFHPHTFTER